MANWTRKWNVTSFTDHTKIYVVSEGTGLVLGVKASVFGCSCPAWRFKKVEPLTGRRPDCKHIQATCGKIQLEKNIELQEATRLLLDEWAVEEVTLLPKLGMLTFEDRSV